MIATEVSKSFNHIARGNHKAQSCVHNLLSVLLRNNKKIVACCVVMLEFSILVDIGRAVIRNKRNLKVSN
jgi:hypothetical protein